MRKHQKHETSHMEYLMVKACFPKGQINVHHFGPSCSKRD